MGMFDSVYDTEGGDWQTKAFDCSLSTYNIGDSMSWLGNCQIEVLGGPKNDFSYATVRDGVLTEVNVPRDSSLPLIDYLGGIHRWVDPDEGA